MQDLEEKTEQIFSASGILSKNLPSFEIRQGQIEMARAVAQSLEEDDPWGMTASENRLLVIEAETGIGKTLAYLVPAVLCGQKIVVSTGTLNLQEQILNKEIPFIKKHIAPDLSALCVKGRQNYLCLYRWHQLYNSAQLPLFEKTDLQSVSNWLETTKTGDRAELDWLPDSSSLWREVTATSSQCLGTTCPDSSNCFINLLRKKAARSQILIVNHHLFFSDLALRRFGFAEVLPRYESVIFDEAHHIENIATLYFGTGFSHFQLLDLAADIEKTCELHGSNKKYSLIIEASRKIAAEAKFFLHIFPSEKGRFPLAETLDKIPDWQETILRIEDALSQASKILANHAAGNEEWGSLQRRTDELFANFRMITGQEQSSYVYWYERRDKTVSLSASPIEIATELQKSFYGEVKTAVFTSATLSTGGTFNYLYERLGLPQRTPSLQLHSPFDYKNRTKLFVPENFPEPAAPQYIKETQKTILEILTASKGRALLLFTSFKAMYELNSYLREHLDYPLFVQGSAPKQTLIDRFSKETHSVLLAVASFWEGVNVPGETLSCVIIDKLPFEVPSDPVIMARINKIKTDGGNPFIDFQVPRAILTLRQGLGRLMRTTTDSGLLAIMDVRLFTKRYGSLFRKSLPESPLIRSIDDVRRFFDSGQFTTTSSSTRRRS